MYLTNCSISVFAKTKNLVFETAVPCPPPEPCERLLGPSQENPDGALYYQQAFRQLHTFRSNCKLAPWAELF